MCSAPIRLGFFRLQYSYFHPLNRLAASMLVDSYLLLLLYAHEILVWRHLLSIMSVWSQRSPFASFVMVVTLSPCVRYLNTSVWIPGLGFLVWLRKYLHWAGCRMGNGRFSLGRSRNGSIYSVDILTGISLCASESRWYGERAAWSWIGVLGCWTRA